MKQEFLLLINDFLDEYPQVNDGKLNYVFSGSIAMNLLSFVGGKIIQVYNFDNQNILSRLNSLKVEYSFKKFFRPITDIDIELYNNLYFEKLNKKFSLKEFDFFKYSSCFQKHIREVYLDILNTKSDIVFEIKLNNKSIWIEDFRYNFGYRLKTLSKLSEDRFVNGHPKYEFTIQKYQYDLNFMCKIFFKWFGKEQTKEFIMHGLKIFADETVDSPCELHLNILLKRIKLLNLKSENEKYLLILIENLKINFYSNLFYKNQIFLLNAFSDVSRIEIIHAGKSANEKYKIEMNNCCYILKTNSYLSKSNHDKRVKIIKRINKYLPNNSQRLAISGYSYPLKKSYICYYFVIGKTINDFENDELFSLGLKAGSVLYQFHKIPIWGLHLKNENSFLNKIKHSAYSNSFAFTDEKLLKQLIWDNDYSLKGKFFLHNDFNLGNILFDGDKIIVIDFDNCVKGDWIIDFKKEIKNNNQFFMGVFLGYWKRKKHYDHSLIMVLTLYEYYYMKNLPKDECQRKKDIIDRHEQFLNYIESIGEE